MGIEWKASLATGIEQVDDQHRELFRKINSFLTACDTGRGKEEVLDILQFLDDYAVHHFRSEEVLQEEYEYPGRVAHKEYHRWFMDRLTELKRRFLLEGKNDTLMREINKVVVNWLLEHIEEKDGDFGRFMQERRRQKT